MLVADCVSQASARLALYREMMLWLMYVLHACGGYALQAPMCGMVLFALNVDPKANVYVPKFLK